ncbi:MAG TPA: NAD-dependent epimerase/dehydratase family protein, partial [Albitalea sp.]|nr:NAD-dependent epimerase/dehydratase family protein [Albitalea sp.]
MKLLITGGAGFLGARLARTLLARGTLAGQTIDGIVLADLVAPPPDLAADPKVQARTGALIDQCAALADEGFDGVFHLASAVSSECELDFERGLRSNVDTTRALLDALRRRVEAGGV